MPPTTELTPDEAREALLNGDRIRMTVGGGAEDPVLVVYEEDGGIVSRAVAGWSAGVTEAVCAAGSSYLLIYLSFRHKLERVEGGDADAGAL